MLPFFGIHEAYLVSGWTASFLWGCFTMLIVYALWGIIQNRKVRGPNIFSTTVIVFLYLLATTHAALSLARLIEGFIVHADDIGPVAYLADISQPINRGKDLVYITSLWLGDTVVVWRCHMVWNKNWAISGFPCLMVFGTALSGYGAIGHYFVLQEGFIEETTRWGDAMFIISLCTNLLVTTITAGRIWWLAHQSGSARRYLTVLLLLIESGAFVTSAKIIEFTLFQLTPPDAINGLNALYIPFDCMPQIAGIVPTLIVIAVNNRLTVSDRITMTDRPSAYNSSRGYSGSNLRSDSHIPVHIHQSREESGLEMDSIKFERNLGSVQNGTVTSAV